MVKQKLLQRFRNYSYKNLKQQVVGTVSVCTALLGFFFVQQVPLISPASSIPPRMQGDESQTFSPKYEIHFHLSPSAIGCFVCVAGPGLNEDGSHKKKSADASALTSSRTTPREGNIAGSYTQKWVLK